MKVIFENNTILTIIVLIFVCFCGCNSYQKVHSEDAFPSRIIALTPSLTETVYALGEGERLVATSVFTSYPEAAAALPRLGGSLSVNAEQILNYKPDLVLMHGSDLKLSDDIRKFGIDTALYSMDTLEGIREGMVGIASELGVRGKGEALWKQTTERMKQVESHYRSEGHHPKVLLVVEGFSSAQSPFYIAEGEAYLSALARLCGAEVAGTGSGNWSAISSEQVVLLNPDVILHFVEAEGCVEPLREAWKSHFSVLRAVADGKVYFMSDSMFTVPGPRVVETLESICRVLQ